MKRKLIIFSIGAVAVAFAGLAVSVNALEAPLSEVAEPVQTASQHYIMKAESGKITVFTGNSEIPEIETDIDTYHLRDYDRQLLEQGIEIDGYENVVGLLEDFSN